jgi:hypothetical protein
VAEASHGWLLVLDNAEDPVALRPYLPGTGGQVPVTSRRADWQSVAFTLPLDGLPEAEAITLLLEPAVPAKKGEPVAHPKKST